MHTLSNRLTALVDAVLEEARTNQEFAAKLGRALGGEMPANTTTERTPAARRASDSSPRRSNRRARAVVDPFALLAVGEPHLRSELAKLNLEQLRDVVAAYGMDTSRLALKWKSPERLIDFIVTTVAARNRKGDVFRDSSLNPGEAGPAGGACEAPRSTVEPGVADAGADLMKELHVAMLGIYQRSLRDTGVNHSLFHQMIMERGAHETALFLVHAPKPSDGYTDLYLKKRLDLTVEALVLEKKWIPIFAEETRQRARKRLTEYKFDFAKYGL